MSRRVFVFIRPDHALGYTEGFLRKLLAPERWSHFLDWMRGQTVGVNELDNTPVYYTYDVERYIKIYGTEKPIGGQ